jgi:glycosyltransferase involved in cell wall biosynthesis
MHIVFLTSEYPKRDFPHGGVGTVIQTIARGLVKNGYQVSIVGLNYIAKHEIENDKGAQIIRLKRKNYKPLTWLINFNKINKALKDLHKSHPIDIVESTELGLAFIKKIKGIKFLIRMNGGHHFFAEAEQRQINWWKGYQEKRSFKNADHVIGVSQYVVNHTSRYIEFKDKFEGVIYNLANLERFTPSDSSNIIPGRVFFAGSLCEKKGIRQLIKAMPIVIAAEPNAHFVVAGRDTVIRGTQNSYLSYLKTQIDETVKNKITFLGAIDNKKIPEEIKKAQICVYPSHMEAMPLAWLEVLAMGKPFIGSSLGPSPEIIAHNKTGLLCNPFDIEKLASQIIHLLKNPEFANKLGKEALKDIIQRFSYDRIMKQNIDLYKSISGSEN